MDQPPGGERARDGAPRPEVRSQNRVENEPRPTLLRELVRRQYWNYARFCREYDKVAMTLGKELVGTYPSERTYKRWLSGRVVGFPRSEPCAVLVAMFPGRTVEQLFAPLDDVTTEVEQCSNRADHCAHDRTIGFQPATTHLVAGVLGGADPPSIAVFRAMSDSFQVADRKLGGGQLYQTVSKYLKSEIAPCLLDPPVDCSSDELFSAAASLTEIAGWMAHDGGQNIKARGHFGQAYRLAIAAENPALSANVCASMAHLAIQLDLPDDADRIATAGLRHAAGCDGVKHLVARLYAMRARAHAMRGHDVECRRALDAAHAALLTSDEGSIIGWIAEFDEASLASEAALCFYSLGALIQAESESRKVIHLRVGDRVRSRAFGQLTLANVLVREGNFDEAAHVGLEICRVAPTLNSVRVHAGLSKLGDALAAHRATPDVATFLAVQAEVANIPTSPHYEARWPV